MKIENTVPPEFAGTVRLFPLPNLVLFPGVIQPLHIFEDRYRRLTEDALESDQLIAMASLRPGWEEDYDGAPPIYSAVCLGQIVAHSRLEDGRYNLLLRGVCRARVEQELSSGTPYRQARVALLTDCGGLSCAELEREISALKRRFARYCQQHACLDAEAMQNLIENDVPLTQLIDLIAYVVDAELELKIQILHAEQLDERLRLLSAILDWCKSPADVAAGEGARNGYPPDFSAN